MRKIVSIVLLACLLCGLFAGCDTKKQADPDPVVDPSDAPIVEDPIVDPEPTADVVARTPEYLSVATADELAEAGITDATDTVYLFKKDYNPDDPDNSSADPNGGPYAMWLENHDDKDFVTFDVRYSSFTNLSMESLGYAGPYLLLMPESGQFYVPTNSMTTFVKKGTDISVEATYDAYNYMELDTWYTVKVSTFALPMLYLSWNRADTATMFITNIVWSD